MRSWERLRTERVEGKEYTKLSERVKGFRSAWPDGCIATEAVARSADGALVKATIYADAENIISTGHAYADNIEKSESLAISRALGFLGIGIDENLLSDYEARAALKAESNAKVVEKGAEKATLDEVVTLTELLEGHDGWKVNIRDRYGVKEWEELTGEQCQEAIEAVEKLRKSKGLT